MFKTMILGAVVAGGLSSVLLAQADAGYSQAARKNWNDVKQNLSASAALMPESGYAFRPTPDVRTFGEILGHVANDQYIMCSQALGKTNPQAGTDFEKTQGKAALSKALNDSITYCDAAYAALKDEPSALAPLLPGRTDTRFSVLMFNVIHDTEHYGNLVTYLRLNKLVPPSSSRGQ